MPVLVKLMLFYVIISSKTYSKDTFVKEQQFAPQQKGVEKSSELVIDM